MCPQSDISGPYQCVQPEIGDQIWRLDRAETPSDLRLRLKNHLAVCDSCRLTLAVQERVQRGAQDHSLAVKTARNRAAGWTWAGGLALAASLALVLLIPPRQTGRLLVRGADSPGFIRPVEGEILHHEAPRLKWTPVAGATAYRIEITSSDQKYHWTARTKQPAVRIPRDQPLPQDEDLLAMVQTVPEDLVSLGAISVHFRREKTGGFLNYRLKAAPSAVKILGLLGLGLLGLGIYRRRHRTIEP